MPNNSSTSHSKETGGRLTRALWLLSLGVVLAEAALRLMPQGFMERTVNARMAEIETMKAPQVQIMGDSVTAGIQALRLEEAAGLPPESVQNYSLPGTSPVFAYYALRRELAAGRAPGAIIYAPHPANLETPMIDRFVGRFSSVPESLELFSHGVTLPQWLFGMTCRVSVAMRYREELRLAVTQGNFGFFTTLRMPAVSVLVSRASIAAPEPPRRALAISPAGFPPQLSAPFFVDKVNANYIDALASLAESHNIQVQWATVPVIGLFKERAMDGGGEEKYQAFLKDLAARHRNVKLLRTQVEVYPNDCFADTWHLNPYGSWRFSAELGRELKESP